MWFMPVMPTPGRQEQEDREFTPTWVTQWDLAQKIKKKWKHLRKVFSRNPFFPWPECRHIHAYELQRSWGHITFVWLCDLVRMCALV
jgi:hypothetical protein